MSDNERIAFVANGKYHCPCGATHERGPVNGVDVYRCLKCGSAFKVRGVVVLRTEEESAK